LSCEVENYLFERKKILSATKNLLTGGKIPAQLLKYKCAKQFQILVENFIFWKLC
jgi:hypothetical protein